MTMRKTFKLILKAFLGSGSDKVAVYITFLSYCRRKSYFKLAKLISYRMQSYGVHISPKAVVPSSIALKHPVGVVIGEGVMVGEDVSVFQNVTIGGMRIGDHSAGNYPIIGDGTTIFAGAVILGSVKIGRGCTIGANAVVRNDVPDYCTAVGVPAKIIARRELHTGAKTRETKK